MQDQYLENVLKEKTGVSEDPQVSNFVSPAPQDPQSSVFTSPLLSPLRQNLDLQPLALCWESTNTLRGKAAVEIPAHLCNSLLYSYASAF